MRAKKAKVKLAEWKGKAVRVLVKKVRGKERVGVGIEVEVEKKDLWLVDWVPHWY